MRYFRIILTAITLLVLVILHTYLFAYSYETRAEKREAQRDENRKAKILQREKERENKKSEVRKTRLIEKEKEKETTINTPQKSIPGNKTIENIQSEIVENRIESKKNNIQTQKKNFEEARKIAKEKRIWEREALKKEKIETRKNQIQTLRNNFESKKKEILQKVDSWEISIKDAREIILQEREKSIDSTKAKMKQEQKIEKQKQIERVESIVHEQINNKLSQLDILSNEKQRKIYEKIIIVLDSKLKSSDISESNQILLWVIRNVIIVKKNSLN